MEKRALTKELKRKWRSLHWPQQMPSFTSDLGEPASDLLFYDTSVAGCISQVIEKGSLEKKWWHVLSVDQDLTDRIAATNDPQTHEFWEYKTQLDECIRLAQAILAQTNKSLKTWIEIGKIVAADLNAKVRCPICGQTNLEIWDEYSEQYLPHRKRQIRCPVCGTAIPMISS